MPKSESGFYAVRVGYAPGVYLSWEECERNVKGFTGASYKKFRTIEGAEAFVGLITSVGGTDRDVRRVHTAIRRDAEKSSTGGGHKKPLIQSPRDQQAPSGSMHSYDHSGKDATANKVRQEYADERKTVVVYTDGACSSNGRSRAIAGIGVWWGSSDTRNLSERCPGLQTNNRAEIYAIVRLLEEAPTSGEKIRLVIKTDSKYTINCVMNWARKWEQKGWMKAPGEKVKNADMLQYLLALVTLHATQGNLIVFEHVRGHSGNVGNEAADALARGGTYCSALAERDWVAAKRRVDNAIQSTTTAPTFNQTNMDHPFEFAIEEGDLLSFEELEALGESQDF